MNEVNETHSYLWQSVLPTFMGFRWIIWWDEVICPIWYLRGMLRRAACGRPSDPVAKLNVKRIFRPRASNFLCRQKVTKELPRGRGISIFP